MKVELADKINQVVPNKFHFHSIDVWFNFVYLHNNLTITIVLVIQFLFHSSCANIRILMKEIQLKNSVPQRREVAIEFMLKFILILQS